ncbi:MAG TPA: FKBP-type peptidyl-prolyl cis-trans isomerase [Polyangiaceae bacterium]|jgi:peptidylprolyl isomerase|nr:FKBP-type peptidyl-prolyl cis-trans isomerase [Polyangiaceae bacterium]
MTQIRLATLACLCALACSGTDESAPADPAPASTSDASGLPRLDAPPDVAAPPPDAEMTASGLASRRLVAGTGTRSPKAADTVRVHYTGWQTDGTRFDSSVARGNPAQFALTGVIKGWTEGLQLMVEGEERRFWIPEELAYKGVSNRPQGMLVFDVQLIQILP